MFTNGYSKGVIYKAPYILPLLVLWRGLPAQTNCEACNWEYLLFPCESNLYWLAFLAVCARCLLFWYHSGPRKLQSWVCLQKNPTLSMKEGGYPIRNHLAYGNWRIDFHTTICPGHKESFGIRGIWPITVRPVFYILVWLSSSIKVSISWINRSTSSGSVPLQNERMRPPGSTKISRPEWSKPPGASGFSIAMLK